MKDFCVKYVPQGLTKFQFLFIYIYFWVWKLPYVGSRFQDVGKIQQRFLQFSTFLWKMQPNLANSSCGISHLAMSQQDQFALINCKVSLKGSIFIFARSQFDWSIIIFWIYWTISKRNKRKTSSFLCTFTSCDNSNPR